MEQIEETKKAIDYLNEKWPKGSKMRGEAMVLMALAQISCREEMRVIASSVQEAKLIILDDNPLSMACYAEEYPENFEAISQNHGLSNNGGKNGNI